MQKYQTKVQQQEHQIQEKDSTIQSQNQTLQHENMKKKSDTPSKQDARVSLTQQYSKPLTYDNKSIRVNFDNMQSESNMDQRVQQAIQTYIV